MFADTDAIRVLGSTAEDHAADLTAIASSLATLPDAAVADLLGPVGAEFVAALAVAAADGAREVAALSERLAATGATAHAAAGAYAAADRDAGLRIGGV